MNKFTKYSYIISFKKNYTIKQLRHVILNKLIKYHEMSQEFTSDRGSLFKLNYWKTSISLLKIKIQLSITYYSQINN